MRDEGRIGRIGMVLPTYPQYGPVSAGLVQEAARRAEDAGVGALWACDHLFWQGPNLECFTALTLAAAATERCSLGSAVLQLPLRRAAAVAKTAASLQVVSDGRLVLGVGSGAHRGEYEAAGVDFGSRGRALDEGIASLREAWDVGQGPYQQRPAPARIPIWIGGSSPAALRRAAGADGWIPMFLSPEKLGPANRLLDEELAKRGRRADEVTRAVLAFVSVGKGTQARDRGLDWMGTLYGLPAGKFARHLVWGEAEACAESLWRLIENGAQHVALFVADDDPATHVEALAGLMEKVPA